MTLLFLSVIDNQQNQREFSCGLMAMEELFDFIDDVVLEGSTLLSAYIIENSARMDLPVAAFDGVPSSQAIQKLEDEWLGILSGPYPLRFIHNDELIELTQRRIHSYKGNIATHERMIEWFDNWLKNAQYITIAEPTRSNLTRQYEHQLTVHQTQLTKLRFHTHLATRRLNQLLA